MISTVRYRMGYKGFLPGQMLFINRVATLGFHTDIHRLFCLYCALISSVLLRLS